MSETIIFNGRPFKVVSWLSPARLPPAAVRKAHRVIPTPLDGEPVEKGTLVLSGPPPSVNALFHNRKKGRGKTLAYQNWRAITDRELRDQPSWHVPGKVKIRLEVYGSRADADNLCKAPIDALVGAGRIQDDRNVVLYAADGVAWSSRSETDAPPPPAKDEAPAFNAVAVE